MNESENPRFQRTHYLIDAITRHKVASNVLMIVLVLAGIRGIRQLTDAEGQLKILITAPDLNQADKILTTSLPKASTGLRVELI